MIYKTQILVSGFMPWHEQESTDFKRPVLISLHVAGDDSESRSVHDRILNVLKGASGMKLGIVEVNEPDTNPIVSLPCGCSHDNNQTLSTCDEHPY